MYAGIPRRLILALRNSGLRESEGVKEGGEDHVSCPATSVRANAAALLVPTPDDSLGVLTLVRRESNLLSCCTGSPGRPGRRSRRCNK